MTKGKKWMWIITGIVILTVFAAGIYFFSGKNIKEYKKNGRGFWESINGICSMRLE